MRNLKQTFAIFIFFLSVFEHTRSHTPELIVQPRVNACPTTPPNGCLFVKCENGGICFNDATTTDCYRCQCVPGYTGKTCQSTIVITPGACNPTCINGGICSGNVCVCPSEFSGSFCETRNYCAPVNPCQNGGRCVSTTNNYVCDCSNTGYTGDTCTQLIPTNPCVSNPCQNGGQCSGVTGTAECICVNGYSGLFCQIAPIPCATTPCENDGRCELLAANTYGCVCPPEFTGSRCETSILANHPCVINPSAACLNGGTCTVNGAGYLCRCSPGWTGPNCATREVISTCNPSPCGLYGTCIEATLPTGPLAVCNCASGWTGKYCDVNPLVTDCPTGYCLSGGTCRVIGNTPYCDCPPLYTGVRCESMIGGLTTTSTTGPVVNFCLPNPCLNGGTCYSTSSNFVCGCTSVWTGTTCNIYQGIATTTILPPIVVGQCASRPCMNGGSCFENGNTFFCACSAPWTGNLCQFAEISTTTLSPVGRPCSSNPCSGNGMCFDSGNTFLCVCQAPWAGPTCSVLQFNSTTAVPPTIDVCNPSPCANGGTCLLTANTFFCVCPSGWSGTRCEISQMLTSSTLAPIGQLCSPNPCQNSGACFSNSNSFTCVCLAPWSGPICTFLTPTITTTPSTVPNCPLNCAPGYCSPSGNALSPYVCVCGTILRPNSCSRR